MVCQIRVQGELLVILYSLSLLGYSPQRVCLLCLTPSFPFRQLGTYALIKLLTLWWGTLFIKIEKLII